MILTTLIFGFLFGALLQYAHLNRFNTISGMATLEDFTVAKALAVAIGLGAILLNVEIALGLASFHVKPLLLGGIVIGGLIFGVGMAILGYCPGTLAVSLGEGSIDALTGIIGGLLGGVVYTLVLPSIHTILGPDLGTISLASLLGSGRILFFILVLLFGLVLIWAAFRLDRKEHGKDRKWLYAGIGLAVLNLVVFSRYGANRPIGASTSYPYTADLLTGVTANAYFEKVMKPGHWELIFLGGAFLAGLIISLIKGEFRFALIHSRWEKYKGSSSMKRIIWAFTGGFILIFGARMAGGCTSGHILSGGMQIAVSSLLFGVFVFTGLLLTGRFFYPRNKL
ncbi:MAG TPA: YeeE/YedE thiosulfate transporter family protein [Bacteroidales bacterium]|nr:YeeE/YedE thiosulfate transporter family protein [Bacteroidales bacterium]